MELYHDIEKISLLKTKLDEYKEKIYKNTEIYNIEIINNKTILEVLYDRTLDADYKYMLSNIIDKSKEFTMGIDIDTNIGLHTVQNIECIYSIEDWFDYHHNNLVDNFTNEVEFYNGLVKYFPKIKFHSDIVITLTTLKGGCVNFTQDIIKSLKCLEVNLKQDIIDTDNNLTEALKLITTKLRLDVTLEGKKDNKNELIFLFLADDNTDKKVYCESHVKLAKSSNSSDTKWYSNRIYFHQGLSQIKNGMILIGHIGKHL
jgi:hypothetical protein